MAKNSIYDQSVAACGSKAAFDKASTLPGAPRKLDSQNDVNWYKANCNQGSSSASSDIFQQILNVCGSQSAVDQASKLPGAPKKLDSQNDVDWYRGKCQSNAITGSPADTISTASAPAVSKTSAPSTTTATTTSKASAPATSTTGSSSGSSGSSASASYTETEPYVAYAEEVGMTPAEFDLYSQEKLLGLQAGYNYDQQELAGNQQLMLQGLRNEAAALTNATTTTNTQIEQDAANWRQQYVADSERAMREYLGDVDYKTKTDTAKIEGQYALDLQDIINAGNKEVESVKGEYNLGAERIRGEYGKDIENIRADYGKYVANVNRDASVFGNFVAGFW
jgi:hypothetical protein